MTQKMIINALDPDEVRIAILKDRTLVDFDIETQSLEKNKGNIYKGIVMAVEPALGAAFVHYGPEKQGFLTATDVHPKYGQAQGTPGKPLSIDKLLKPGQTVLVQVSKDEIGQKGAVLTTYLSLAGRYLVLMPDSDTHAISRKIDDEDTRRRIHEATSKLDVPPHMGVIIRTAGRDRNKTDLNRDLKVLVRLWQKIKQEAEVKSAPCLIFKEQDVVIRALRDYFSSEIDEIVLDSDEAYDRAAEYMHMVMPNLQSVLTRYCEKRPIFHHYQIEKQLAAISRPRVELPSGGSIVIQSTEALVAVDVNSGRQKLATQEETALKTNLEAAQEIARQLRLRDLGGIIVIDFIDMALNKNQQRVERVLKHALVEDKAKIKIGKISKNGTLEMTRQRLRSALQTTLFVPCQHCQGMGHILNTRSQMGILLRELTERAAYGNLQSAVVKANPNLYQLCQTEYKEHLNTLQKKLQIKLECLADANLAHGKFDFIFTNKPEVKPIVFDEPNFGPVNWPEGFVQEDTLEKDLLLHFAEAEEKHAWPEEHFSLPTYEFVSRQYVQKYFGKARRPEKSAEPSSTPRHAPLKKAYAVQKTEPARRKKIAFSRRAEHPAQQLRTKNGHAAQAPVNAAAQVKPQKTSIISKIWNWFQGSSST